MKIAARGPWPYLRAYQAGPPAGARPQRAIRSARELAEVAGPHALPAITAALKVKSIDFTRDMLIVVPGTPQPLVGVSGGGPPSAPSRIEVARIDRDNAGKVLTVHWLFVPRGDEILTAPLAAVLVPRFDGDVRFERTVNLAPAAAGREVKVRARAFWPDGWPAEEPPQQWVVRSYAGLIDPRLAAPEPVLEKMRQEALAKYLRVLHVKSIDFDKQMIVGASGGTQPAGARVEITQILRGKGALTVRWKLEAPRGAPAAALTHPAEVVLVERFAGEVRFDPPAPVSARGKGRR